MLQEGQLAPGFTLEASTGEKVSLSNFTGKKVVLYFYPKDDTPGCTVEACDFRDNKEEFDANDAVVIGVSKDSLQSHQGFISKHNLNFILLSDPEATVIKAYGAWGKKAIGKEGIIRTTILIDEYGKVAKNYPNVKVKGHIEEVLAGL